jgi:hypothetical protein
VNYTPTPRKNSAVSQVGRPGSHPGVPARYRAFDLPQRLCAARNLRHRLSHAWRQNRMLAG